MSNVVHSFGTFSHDNLCKRTANKRVKEERSNSRIAGMNAMATSAATKTTTENSPVTSSGPVWVQCPGYRCLAYQDGEGNWRTFFNGTVLSKATPILNGLGKPSF
jgi:hypothetical protein